VQIDITTDEQAIVGSLLNVSMDCGDDNRGMLLRMLREARKLLRAEAGKLFVREGERLRLIAAQNDVIGDESAQRGELHETHSIRDTRLTAFVARTGMLMNLADVRDLPDGTPFHVDLSADARTRYRTRSVLAVPLQSAGGECHGVLELINHQSPAGDILKFPAEDLPKIEALASVASLAVRNMQLQEELKTAHLDTIIRLAVAAEYRDDDTAAHIRRISGGSAVLARAMGLPKTQVELLQYASPMHDIGKIGIPDSILRKPGPLTPEERDLMQTHTLIGAKIFVDPQTDVIRVARDVAHCHHERWDGLGYPRGIEGEDIPLYARIVAIVDVFDALLAKRCYKDAYSLEKALGIITKEKGKHFDPTVAEAFVGSLDELQKTFRTHRDDPQDAPPAPGETDPPPDAA
jgi:HD-GYP domain-containing protein (c-di-GMP phosphodiesterase class II)